MMMMMMMMIIIIIIVVVVVQADIQFSAPPANGPDISISRDIEGDFIRGRAGMAVRRGCLMEG
jgi:hypothetical protein